ncbi:MAG: patatin-like phospholipase family protein, partial [Burkholderiales bacterium]|nr:patatin-like phospholipase family protein [Burkholderiales bacterium]
VPFLFVPVVFAALCSDLREYKLADAVAASMAVPLLFAPVVVRSWPERCTLPQSPWVTAVLAEPSSLIALATAEALAGYRAGQQPHFVKLVDGGVADNYGLSGVLDWRLDATSPLGLLTAKDAVTMERMLLLLVDAGRSRSGDWNTREPGPAGAELALSVANAGVDAAARLSADFFSTMLDRWQQSIVEFRCGLSEAQVQQLRGSLDGWDCRNVRFERDMVSIAVLDPDQRRRFDAIPTRLKLSAAQVDEAIDAGRRGLQATAGVRAFAATRR